MKNDNPYHPPVSVGQSIPSLEAYPTRALWLAYLFAPAVAPVSFIALVFAVIVVASLFGVGINEASVAILPIVGLVAGFFFSYLAAGVIGMPIVFLLRSHRALNGYSILGVALALATLFTVAISMTTVGDDWSGLTMWIGFVGALVVPPVFLTGLVFWWLVRWFSGGEKTPVENNR
jgi:hypothetical protein